MAAHPQVCQVQGDGRVRDDSKGKRGKVIGFEEAVPTFSSEEARLEAKRCAASSPCHYCDVCQLLCPDLAIVRDPESRDIVFDLNFCKGCGLCAHYCPKGAITMVVDE